MQSVIENFKPNQHKRQGFFLPPPSKPRKGKDPKNAFLSFLDQGTDGLYGGLKMVRNAPQTNRDIYFTVRTRTTEVRSNRRNKTHRNIALFKTKRDGPTRSNIAFMTCSFLELDGSTDGRIKSLEDVLTLIRNNNLPTASYLIETSRGHYHILWTYVRPLPWTEKFKSYWTAQQTRLIQLFEKGGFLVDKGASLNPCQNLRNPSQLQPYNFKRRCKVYIHSTYKKTSLRLIYRALNKTSVPNPAPIRASVKLRQYERQNQTFITTHKELAIDLNLSPRTIKREIKQAVQNGDLRIVARLGNNSEKTRTTHYESLIFIEKFPEVPLVSIKTNSFRAEALLRNFKLAGARKGRRQKTIFALGLYLKARLEKTACIEAIRAELLQGARACHVSEKEFERTLQNVMKPTYEFPLSLAKMRQWDLIEGTKHFH